MNNKLSALNGFIEKKAKTLLDLDLVSQSEVDGILGINDADESPSGHSFADVFSSDHFKDFIQTLSV